MDEGENLDRPACRTSEEVQRRGGGLCAGNNVRGIGAGAEGSEPTVQTADNPTEDSKTVSPTRFTLHTWVLKYDPWTAQVDHIERFLVSEC